MKDSYPVECPKCINGTLDTGGECNDCDFDIKNQKQNFVDGFKKASGKSKEELAQFLRENVYGNLN